ncbi:MAG TPA: hypothetical protein PJ984_02310 [Candidatus Saccharibacteria bacterium]|jgi:hypothetical protein|nr:hypothetical protein [Candidatus Saccharibacteria bacterium]
MPPIPFGESSRQTGGSVSLLVKRKDSVLKFEDRARAQKLASSMSEERICKIIPPSPPFDKLMVNREVFE